MPYIYHYIYRDHLGNNRLVYADLNNDGVIQPATEIVEENNYYPFGLKHTGYNEIANSCKSEEAEQYKLNGKEYEDSFGLNVYEMDLRQYDPAIGRWTVQDLVTHHDYSPYSAFDNNPVFWSDPSGADSQTYVTLSDLWNKAGSGITSFTFENGVLTGESHFKSLEAFLQNFFEIATPDTDGDGEGDGGGGGKNQKANSRGVGRNYGQMGLLGMSSYTFFGAPIRLIPYDFGAASYFGGAINVYVGAWKEYLKEGLNSYIGRHLMHEYGHYLQEKYGGLLKYYGIVPYKSLGTINESSAVHASNWVELQANTLAYYYFGTPEKFVRDNGKIDYFSINYNYIKIPSQILFEIQNGYLQHPDYKQ